MSEPITLDIWPGLAPGESTSDLGKRVDMYGRDLLTDVTHPTLTVYPFDSSKSDAPCILVLPGGGYEILADLHEGIDIAKWLNTLGFAAAVLRYRVPRKRDSAFADAERAIRVLQDRSTQFGIGTNRIGVLGFSAGGHLAARLSTRYAYTAYERIDTLDEISARPDFTVLIYPAYLIDDKGTVPNEVKPHQDQPPLFMTQTLDDHVFCAEAYGIAAKEAGVDVHLALYDEGGHGYGLEADPSLPVSNWPKEAEKWLKEKFLTA